MAEDGFAQCLGAFQLSVEIGFEMVDDGTLVFYCFDNGFLFSEGRDSHN